MFNGGKRLVEMMQQALPFLILGSTAEANGVRFQRFPAYEENVAIRNLDAALQLMRDVAGPRGNDGLGVLERRLIRCFASHAHIQHRDLENHRQLQLGASISAVPRRSGASASDRTCVNPNPHAVALT